MDIDSSLILSINRLSLIINRYVNKRIKSSIDKSMNISTFKLLSYIKNLHGQVRAREYFKIGCDRTTFIRNMNIIVNNGLAIKGEVPFKDRKVRKARILFKLTDNGEELLKRTSELMDVIDNEFKKLWDFAYRDSILNRASYLSACKYKEFESPPELDSSGHFARIVDGFCEYIRKIKPVRKNKDV